MIDVYPHQLSGGQRQRIMIAAALVLDPVLLIADEPTTALDVTTQAQILKLIKELRERRNTGVLFITHDFGVVAEIAHRVVVMQHGRVVEQGTTEDVLRRPRDDYTRMLIRSVPSLSPPARAPITAAPIVLQTEGLTKTYVSGGFFAKRREVQAAKDVEPARPARRDARRGRRVRLGQVHGRALHRAADRAERRRDPDRRRRRREALGRARCARTASACRSCSRTRIARSIRAARSAPRSSRARSISAWRRASRASARAS